MATSTSVTYDKIPVELPTESLLTDEQIRQQAADYGELAYGGALAEAKQAYDRGVLQQQQTLDRYRQQYEQEQRKTGLSYAQQGNSIQLQALSRGFGRSTYVQDALRQNDVRQQAAIGELATQFQQQNAQIDQQLNQLLAEYNDASTRLTQERGKAISQKVAELTQQRYQNQMQLKSLETELWKQQLAQQQFAEQQALQRETLQAQLEQQRLQREQEQAQFEAQLALQQAQFDWQKQQAAASAAQAVRTVYVGGSPNPGPGPGGTEKPKTAEHKTINMVRALMPDDVDDDTLRKAVGEALDAQTRAARAQSGT